MAKLTRGRVLFVLSSVVCGVPPKYMTMYTTLKYTQLGLMRSLAAEYASTSVGINAISPSMVETQFLSEISEIAVQMSAAANPQGRKRDSRGPARRNAVVAFTRILLYKGKPPYSGWWCVKADHTESMLQPSGFLREMAR